MNFLKKVFSIGPASSQKYNINGDSRDEEVPQTPGNGKKRSKIVLNTTSSTTEKRSPPQQTVVDTTPKVDDSEKCIEYSSLQESVNFFDVTPEDINRSIESTPHDTHSPITQTLNTQLSGLEPAETSPPPSVERSKSQTSLVGSPGSLGLPGSPGSPNSRATPPKSPGKVESPKRPRVKRTDSANLGGSTEVPNTVTRSRSDSKPKGGSFLKNSEPKEKKGSFLMSLRLPKTKKKAELKALQNTSATKIQAVYRGRLARKFYKLALARRNIVRELLVTELDYVRFITVLIKVFYTPLRKKLKTKDPILSSDELKTIFTQIENIQDYNSKFLEMIQKKLREWSVYQTIGDAFITMIDFFEPPYTAYIAQFPKMTEQIFLCSRRPAFAAFLAATRNYTECAGQDLNSLVSMPFQRIPRYIILMKEALKFTTKANKDFQLLPDAMRKVERLANAANEQLRERESLESVLAINKLLDPPIQNLVRPNRKFIRSGDLKVSVQAQSAKPTDKGNKFRVYRSFLFSDCILFAESSQKMFDKETKFKPKHIVSLQNAVMLDYDTTEETEFILRCEIGVIRLQAVTWPEKEAWLDELLTTISALSTRRGARTMERTTSVTLRLPNRDSVSLAPSQSVSNISNNNSLRKQKIQRHPTLPRLTSQHKPNKSSISLFNNQPISAPNTEDEQPLNLHVRSKSYASFFAQTKKNPEKTPVMRTRSDPSFDASGAPPLTEHL